MNSKIKMMMTDCETPFAIMPYEMLNIDMDAVPDKPALYSKLLEVNTMLAKDQLVAVPSMVEGVDGLFLVRLNEREYTDSDLAAIRLFLEPVHEQATLEAIGAGAAVTFLQAEKV